MEGGVAENYKVAGFLIHRTQHSQMVSFEASLSSRYFSYVTKIITSQVAMYIDDCPVPPVPFEELPNIYVATSDRPQKYTPKSRLL